MARARTTPRGSRGQSRHRPFRRSRHPPGPLGSRLPGRPRTGTAWLSRGQALRALPPDASVEQLCCARPVRRGAAVRVRRRALRLGVGLAVSRRRRADQLRRAAGDSGALAAGCGRPQAGPVEQPCPLVRLRSTIDMTTSSTPTRPTQGRAQLRVGLVGAGMISYHHLIAWSRQERVQVVAVCDPQIERARQRAAEFGIPAAYDRIEAMLDKHALDAVDIASPRETHAGLVDIAAARGIDALCQKPLTPTFAEGAALADRIDGAI